MQQMHAAGRGDLGADDHLEAAIRLRREVANCECTANRVVVGDGDQIQSQLRGRCTTSRGEARPSLAVVWMWISASTARGRALRPGP